MKLISYRSIKLWTVWKYDISYQKERTMKKLKKKKELQHFLDTLQTHYNMALLHVYKTVKTLIITLFCYNTDFS